MRKDPGTFIVGEGIAWRGGCFGQTAGLYEEFGAERVLDTPISEAGITGMCVGAAACGSRAIVDIMFCDFIMLAMEQLINQAAKLRYMSRGQYNMPLTVLGVSGAYHSGGPHHSQSIHSWFMNVPGIIVVLPSNAYDLKGLLAAAILENDVAVVLPHKGLLTVKCEVPEEDYLLPLGEAKITREGDDVTIVAAGMVQHLSIQAADLLAAQGIQAEVIDPRTLIPFDEETVLKSVRKTGRLVVVDEGPSTCGVGAEIIARVQEKVFDYLDAPMQRVHPVDSPVPFNPTLELAWLPDVGRVVHAVKKIL